MNRATFYPNWNFTIIAALVAVTYSSFLWGVGGWGTIHPPIPRSKIMGETNPLGGAYLTNKFRRQSSAWSLLGWSSFRSTDSERTHSSSIQPPMRNTYQVRGQQFFL